MPGILIKNEDGTYDATYRTRYSIVQGPAVYNMRTGKALLPDEKNRVTLSCGGETRRVNVEKTWSDTMEAELYPGVQTVTTQGNIDIYLGEFHWRVPAAADFKLSEQKNFEFTPLPRQGIADKLLQRLVGSKSQDSPAGQCTFSQLLRWSEKYAEDLAGLPGAYDLYRDLLQLHVNPSPIHYLNTSIIRMGVKHLALYADGGIYLTTETDVKALYSEVNTPTEYSSKLLANNRLTLKETNGLISGPFTPLLAWAFRGVSYEDEVLFNITGNTKDFSASNYTWVPREKVTTYTQIRIWLTKRWAYENGVGG